jgi:hypothetical protein
MLSVIIFRSWIMRVLNPLNWTSFGSCVLSSGMVIRLSMLISFLPLPLFLLLTNEYVLRVLVVLQNYELMPREPFIKAFNDRYPESI